MSAHPRSGSTLSLRSSPACIVRALVIGSVVGSSAGCVLILDPERLDDVARCHYHDDCPEPPDVRYTNICTVAGDDDDPPFPKICAPRPSVSCDPLDYDYESPFRTRVRELDGHADVYENACEELGPVRGCTPGPDGCASGLAPDLVSHRCDDDDPDSPPAISPVPSVAGQDVHDQFCRSVFCDSRFVCDHQTETCVACTLGEPIGKGGCGDLYPGGVRSPIYLDDEQMDEACGGPQGDPGDALVGEFEG